MSLADKMGVYQANPPKVPEGTAMLGNPHSFACREASTVASAFLSTAYFSDEGVGFGLNLQTHVACWNCTAPDNSKYQMVPKHPHATKPIRSNQSWLLAFVTFVQGVAWA